MLQRQILVPEGVKEVNLKKSVSAILTGRSHRKKSRLGRAKKRLTITLLQHLTVFTPYTFHHPRNRQFVHEVVANISPWRRPPRKTTTRTRDRHIDTRGRDHLHARHDRMVAPTGLACSRNASRMSERGLVIGKIDACERMKGYLIQSVWLSTARGELREVIATFNHRILSACHTALNSGENIHCYH